MGGGERESMEEYLIVVKTTAKKVIEVPAPSYDEAIDKAMFLIRNEKIDWKATDIEEDNAGVDFDITDTWYINIRKKGRKHDDKRNTTPQG